ncbi:helitron helicase-like domain-containing protein [Tanacetum coccineum]
MLFTMRETYVDRNPKSHKVLGIAPVAIIDRQLPFEYTITSRSTDVVVMALPVQNINHSAFRSMFEREKLSGNNFNDWFRQLKLVLRVEKKMFVIEQPIPPAPAADSAANVLAEWNAIYDAYNEVACLMLGSMTPELHRQFENYSPYEMLQELKSMFEKQAGVERFDLIQTFHACKQEEGKPVAAYVLKMKGYVEQLERLGYVLPQDLSVGLILNGLTSDFAGFVRNYNMHNMGKTIGELHALLIEYEKGLPKKAETPQVMAIKGGKIQKTNKKSLKAKGMGKANGKGKDKKVYIPKPKNPKPTAKEHPAKDDTCHHCKEVGHWKRNCPVYLAELLKKKKQVDTASSSGCVSSFTLVLVDLPPNCKTVGSKWIFKKKTYMDGIVHTYKAHLVAKGYTQLYEVDYEETFSPVTDIRAIRILISIAAFYDYEIWKIDVKTAFLNGYLDEDIYMVQTEVRCTRPDVAFLQIITSHFQQNSGEPHWTAVKNILKYLRNTKDMFSVYGGNSEAELRVDCYCAVDWKSSKQSTTAMSATEAEYIPASEAAMEAV